jgi:CHAD domain-containing protein
LLLDALRGKATGSLAQCEDDRARTEEPGGKPGAETAGTFCDTMRELIGDRWAVLWRTLPVALEGADIEGVHDVRVASRRLRAAMDIGAVCFPKRWYKPLHRAAKEITKRLGEVRDRDVMLQVLAADRDAAPPPDRPGIDRLVARIGRERESARAEMESYLSELLGGALPCEIEKRFGLSLGEDETAHAVEPPR